MSAYLTLSGISKSYTFHQILNQITFVLNEGERIGLVGANGVGKSTLLKIIVGEIEADSGTVTLAPERQLGYLRQVMTQIDGKTLEDFISEATAQIHRLDARLRELEYMMGSQDVMDEYGDTLDQFERYGGYELDSRVDTVLNGLRVGHLPRHRLVSTLSGGEKARVGLALLLLQSPDVLLLDEPTNHLDHASLEWLENYLRSYRGAVLVVSHDRHFLNRAVNAIVEIDEHTRGCKRYNGDYDTYQLAKQRERRKWEQDFSRQQEEIKVLRLEVKETARRNDNYRTPSDGDKLLLNAKKANHERTVSKRVRAAEEKLNRILADPIPQPPDPLRFEPDFDPHALTGRLPLVVSNVTKIYGLRHVLDNVSFSVQPDSRILLVGENGAGKSTLLRLITGVEKPDEGEIYVHPAVRIGYLDQEQRLLNPALNVFDAYKEGLPGHDQQLMSVLLRSCLFRYEELDRKVGDLSSGQQRKLQIARLIAGRANVLLLDEPTNYISFDVLEEMEDALKVFPGAVIAASHDRRFIQQFGGEVWEVTDGQLSAVSYPV